MESNKATPEGVSPYTLATLAAIRRGLFSTQRLRVWVADATGHVFSGQVVGIGSKLSVKADDGEWVDDLRAEWVRHAEVTER